MIAGGAFLRGSGGAHTASAVATFPNDNFILFKDLMRRI
jgi:hypothetical protein